MMPMLAPMIFVASLLLIYVGSEKIVYAASHISHSLNFHKAVVGAIFVASITSTPELLSSLTAAIFSSSQMALGNIIGSNIYNIPLVIGICGLIGNFKIKNSTISRECLFIIGLSILLMLLTAATGTITRHIGIIFLALYVVFILYLVNSNKENNCKKAANGGLRNITKSVAIIIIGGIALTAGTFLLVYSITSIAEALGLSHFCAGFTMMALGCVAPEVAVSISSAIKGEPEISIGNVIGDNIITMTLILGLIILIRDFTVSPLEILTTVPFIILVTSVLLVMDKRGYKVTRSWSLLMFILVAIALILELLGFY